jgi:hypothetical protein
MPIHMDNCKVDNAEEILITIRSTKMTSAPPYSADHSPCDCWFFRLAKNSLRDDQFDDVDVDVVFKRLLKLFDEIRLEELQSVFLGWIRRLTQVIQRHGEYFAK